MNKEKFSKEIKDKVNGIEDMKKVAEQVTLTEFIEQYMSRFDYITLGSMWYAVNKNEVDIDFTKEISYGGTSTD